MFSQNPAKPSSVDKKESKTESAYDINKLIEDYLSERQNEADAWYEKEVGKNHYGYRGVSSLFVQPFGKDLYAVGIETRTVIDEASGSKRSLVYLQVQKEKAWFFSDSYHYKLKEIFLKNDLNFPEHSDSIKLGSHIVFRRYREQTIYVCKVGAEKGKGLTEAARLDLTDAKENNNVHSIYSVDHSSYFLVRTEHHKDNSFSMEDPLESWKLYQFDGKKINLIDTVIDHIQFRRQYSGKMDVPSWSIYSDAAPKIESGCIVFDMSKKDKEPLMSVVFDTNTHQKITLPQSEIQAYIKTHKAKDEAVLASAAPTMGKSGK